MGRSNNQIIDNFNIYKKLRKERKIVKHSPIDVCTIKMHHPTYKLGRVPAVHKTIKKAIVFEVEVKANDTGNFKFKLFCSDYFQRPFFRFDSSGASHWTADDTVPLGKRLMEPPHFHEWTEQGIEIAYKTKLIKSKAGIDALADINECIIHFCREGNVRYENAFPEVLLHKGEFPFSFTNEDPLRNIQF